MSRKHNTKRGDTIVEVVFSIAILSFTILSLMLVMQKGSNAVQLSLELNLARNHMNAQAEAIRFINASIQNRERTSEAGQTSEFSSIWRDMISEASASVSEWKDMTTVVNGEPVCREAPSKSFVLDLSNIQSGLQKGGVLTKAEVYPRMVYNNGADNNKIQTDKRFVRSEGIWVEVERASGSDASLTDAYDFHIRACWKSVGQSAPITLGTIVRVHVSKTQGVE